MLNFVEVSPNISSDNILSMNKNSEGSPNNVQFFLLLIEYISDIVPFYNWVSTSQIFSLSLIDSGSIVAQYKG